MLEEKDILEENDNSNCVDCICRTCEIRNECGYHGCNNCGGCSTEDCIKEDEESGNDFLGYDVDDPDDLEDCYEDLYEGDC